MVVGAFTVETDVAVIGAGAAGVAAALRAAEHGRSVALIDRHAQPGGEHVRCAARGRLLEAKPGDLAALPAAWEEAARACAAPLLAALEAAGITFVCGGARFESARDLAIRDNTAVPRLHFRRAIIASGSGCAADFIAACDLAAAGKRVRLPAQSAAGIETACLLAAAGCKDVTLEGAFDLPAAAEESVRAALSDLGITVDAQTENPQPSGSNPSALDAHRAGVKLDSESGCLLRSEGLRTHEPRVLAAGAAVSRSLDLRGCVLEGRAAADAACGVESVLVHPAASVRVLLAPLHLAWCGEDERAGDLALTRYGHAEIFSEAHSGAIRGGRATGPSSLRTAELIAAAIEMGAVTDDLEVLLAGCEFSCAG